VRQGLVRNNVVAFALLWFVVLTLGRTGTGAVTAEEAAASLVICAASLYMLVLVHEVGHALAGWVTCFGVAAIRVGRGPALVSARVRGVDIALHLFPSGGYTTHRQGWSRPWYRLRRLVTVAGGVLANAAVIAVAVTMLSGRWELALVITNATTILRNLRPHRFRSVVGSVIPSDGAQLLALLRSPSWKLEYQTSSAVARIARLLNAGRSAEALEVLESDTTTIDHPVIAASLRAAALAEQGRAAEAIEIWRHALAGPRFPKTLRAVALNGLAFAYFALDDPANLPEADAASAEARRLEPDSAAILDTRALVLIAQGKPTEALRLARRACSMERNPFTRARTQTTVAMALAGGGELEEASRFLEAAAATLPPDDWQLARARRTFAAV